MSFREEDVKPLESALAALQPAAPALQRDRLLFRAGQLAARRGRWIWPLLTVFSTSAALYLGWVVLERAAAPPAREIVVVREPAPGPSAPPAVPQVAPPLAEDAPPAPISPAPSTVAPVAAANGYSFDLPDMPVPSYRHLQNQALRWGVEALPTGTTPDPNLAPEWTPAPSPVTSAGSRPALMPRASIWSLWR